MQKVTLTKIFTTDKDKAGQPLMSKTGKPYTRMSIKVAEHGEKWISGFKGKENASWKEGDTVEITIEQKGEYLNFSVPKAEDLSKAELDKLSVKVGNVVLRLAVIEEHLGIKTTDDYKKLDVPPTVSQATSTGMDYPDEDINIDDIPF